MLRPKTCPSAPLGDFTSGLSQRGFAPSLSSADVDVHPLGSVFWSGFAWASGVAPLLGASRIPTLSAHSTSPMVPIVLELTFVFLSVASFLCSAVNGVDFLGRLYYRPIGECKLLLGCRSSRAVAEGE